VDRHASHAILDEQTRLAVAVHSEVAAHPGESGVHPMSHGLEAFAVRIALARAAQRTLDLQYYDFHDDDTGAALLTELLAAADRGVRVRLLLDDLHTAGHDDLLIAVNSHPNLEVRLFNPFVHRHARWVDYLGAFSRLDCRMHNKSMTADSKVSVVGGRNIGDEYFGASAELDFTDFDVIAIGPVVAQVSAEFDEYWNSDVVYPLSALEHGAVSKQSLAKTREELAQRAQALRATPFASAMAPSDLARSLQQKDVTLYWGRATVIADLPPKVLRPAKDSSTHAMPQLRARLDGSHRELILISAYFIPGESGTRWLQDLSTRGVRVTILTNSFEATDVRSVTAAYSRYREPLVRSGVELYEFKPTNPVGPKGKRGVSTSSLHAKTYLADAHTLFVGSMNLDPRSAALNTEMGVIIESDSLGAQIRDSLLPALPDIAYHVQLDSRADSKGRLVWVTREQGHEVRYESEPGVSFLNSIAETFERVLPMEDQL
jgi:putative cardiolipin synthase